MDREGGEHVGQQGTAAQRQGHHVAAVARNDARRRRDDAREWARAARERIAALEQLKRAIEKEAALVPLLPALPDIVVTDATLPAIGAAISDFAVAMNVDPVPRTAVSDDVPMFPLPAQAPHIPVVPPTSLAASPISRPSIPPAPSLTAVPATVSRSTSVPILSSIGDAVPDAPKPPALTSIGKAPPILRRMGRLHDIRLSAPTFDAPPGLTKLGKNAPAIPAVPPVYRIGTAVPNMPSPRFELWDLGPDLAHDADDDAIEKDLRAAVERETVRRQEVASAKPLDPFGGMPESRPHPEFEELLLLLQKQPDLLTIHKGQMFPGDALPVRLRTALHDYALNPRARAMMVNAVKNAITRADGNDAVKAPASVVARATAVRSTQEMG